MNYSTFPIWRALDERREYEDELDEIALERLASAVSGIVGVVKFDVKGGVNQQQQKAIMGSAHATLAFICQRCLEVYQQDYIIPLHWVPVRDEEAIEKVGDDEIALLITEETVNLIELIEDEFLLALPLVPKHLEDQACEGRVYLEEQILVQEEKTHPFAELSKLLNK